MTRWLALSLVGVLVAGCECGGDSVARPARGGTDDESISTLAAVQLVSGDTFTCALRDAHVVCWGVHGVMPTDAEAPPAPGEPAVVEAFGDAVELAGDSSTLLCARGRDRSVRCSFGGREAVEVEALAGAVSLAGVGAMMCGVVRDEAICVAASSARTTELARVDHAVGVRAAAGAVVVLRGDQDAHFVSVTPDGAARVGVLARSAGASDAGGGGGPCVVVEDGLVRCARSDAVAIAPEGDEAWIVTTEDAEDLGVAARLFRVGRHTCAVSAQGRATCSDAAPDFVMLAAQLDAPVHELSGAQHVCVLRGDDPSEVLCWGDDVNGQAGRTPSSPAIPSRVQGLGNATDVVAQDEFACALSEGALWCWDSGVFSSSPVLVPHEGTASLDTLVRAGEGACARDTAGAVHCVYARRLNQGARAIDGLDASGGLLDGGGRACAVGARGALACMGLAPLPIPVSGFGRADALAVGLRDVWGLRSSALISDSAAHSPQAATQAVLAVLADAFPSPLPADVARMFAGAEQFFWLDTAGALHAAGHNGSGQLGLPPSPPVRQGALSTLTDVPTGMSFAAHASCAWTADGPIHCAGLDERLVPRDPRFGGQRGDGSWRQIPGVQDVLTVDQGARMGCAVLSGGEVRCWGVGARGDGRPRTLDAPTRVVWPN